jgi:hypothetical protein
MADLQILPATLDHCRLLAGSLRAEDLRECLAAGSRPFKALWRSWRGSPAYRKTAFVDGKIAAMWGCGGAWLSEEGLPWLLTSPAVETIPLKFLHECRSGVEEMLALYPVLRNYVHADYDRSIRFLRLVGFDVGAPEPYGPHKQLFRPVRLTRAQWAN